MAVLEDVKYYNLAFDGFSVLNNKYKTRVIGYCILPNQINLILTGLQEEGLSRYLDDFKTLTRKEIIRLLEADKKVQVVASLEIAK
ncbi:unnamed protein product, partial [Scytosiphon promiscuus]